MDCPCGRGDVSRETARAWMRSSQEARMLARSVTKGDVLGDVNVEVSRAAGGVPELVISRPRTEAEEAEKRRASRRSVLSRLVRAFNRGPRNPSGA